MLESIIGAFWVSPCLGWSSSWEPYNNMSWSGCYHMPCIMTDKQCFQTLGLDWNHGLINNKTNNNYNDNNVNMIIVVTGTPPIFFMKMSSLSHVGRFGTSTVIGTLHACLHTHVARICVAGCKFWHERESHAVRGLYLRSTNSYCVRHNRISFRSIRNIHSFQSLLHICREFRRMHVMYSAMCRCTTNLEPICGPRESITCESEDIFITTSHML